jgi:hypothetical protein
MRIETLRWSVIALWVASAAHAGGRQPEVFKLTREQEMKLHVQRLGDRVEALEAALRELRSHTHELHFGRANFYLNPAPSGDQRVGVNIPIFTTQRGEFNRTSPPVPPRAVHTSRRPTQPKAPATANERSKPQTLPERLADLDARVRSLEAKLRSLRDHTHTLHYGRANFYLNVAPSGDQRVLVNIPFFTTQGDEFNRTSPPDAEKTR